MEEEQAVAPMRRRGKVFRPARRVGHARVVLVAQYGVADQSASLGETDLMLEFRSVDILGYRNRPCARFRRPYPGMRRP